MDVWRGVKCKNNLTLINVDPGSSDLGYVQAEYKLGGGSLDIVADIQFGAFWPREVFDLFFGPGGGERISAVAANFAFTDDETGAFTDINNDGLMDTAFSELYFNTWFPFCLEGSCSTEVNKLIYTAGGYTFSLMYSLETIFAHEFGHSLSLDHFNRQSLNLKDGSVNITPDSLMSTYLPTPRAYLGPTDNAAYCKTWNSWPNN